MSDASHSLLTCACRVQNTSNVITWTFTAGDPSPVDILVVNSDNTTLNGAFDIARFVDVSIQVRGCLLQHRVRFIDAGAHSPSLLRM